VAVRNTVPFTEREYLALEAVAEVRHELIAGQSVGMTGAEPEHNQIVQSLRTHVHRGALSTSTGLSLELDALYRLVGG